MSVLGHSSVQCYALFGTAHYYIFPDILYTLITFWILNISIHIHQSNWFLPARVLWSLDQNLRKKRQKKFTIALFAWGPNQVKRKQHSRSKYMLRVQNLMRVHCNEIMLHFHTYSNRTPIIFKNINNTPPINTALDKHQGILNFTRSVLNIHKL